MATIRMKGQKYQSHHHKDHAFQCKGDVARVKSTSVEKAQSSRELAEIARKHTLEAPLSSPPFPLSGI